MERIENGLLAAAVFLAPWASVGVWQTVSAGLPGPGVQPAILPLAALVLLVGVRALRRPQLARGETAALVACTGLVAATALGWSLVDMGLAGERPWSKSLKQLLQWLFFVAAALAVARVVARERAVVVERALSVGLLIACLLAIARAVGDAGLLLPGLLDSNPSIAAGSDELYLGHSFTGIARLRGPMPEPLMFGSYLLAAAPLAGLAALGRSGAARWWRGAVVLLALACLFGTWSRGAWAGGAALGLALGWLASRGRFGRPSRRRVLGAVLVAALGAGVAAALVLQVGVWEVPGLLRDRIGQSLAAHDMSNLTRLWAWRAAWDAFRDAPLFGHGFGSFGFLFQRYAPEGAAGAHFGWPVPNNLALLLLAETGLIGAALWAAALAPALSGLVERRQGALGAVLGCALLGVLVQLATFSQWNLPHLWLLFGAALGATRVRAVGGGAA